MQETYVPRAVKAGKFSGSVTMKLLTFDERMALAEKQVEGMNHIALMRKMLTDYKGKWATVSLTRLSDGKEFKSLDDLQYGKDCHDIIMDVAGWLVGGAEEEGKTGEP